jgi:drug/metabolite transporter (DMT)-like permease
MSAPDVSCGPMTTTKRFRLIGYTFAALAGAIWGTTGPLSTALYKEGAAITSVGFWRILLAALGFVIYGLFSRDLFKIDRKGVLIVMVIGGALVAVFEVPFQFAIAGLGVAPAVALLYTAPVLVAVIAHFLLGEKLTFARVLLAIMVMVGVGLTVYGTDDPNTHSPTDVSFAIGLLGGIISALGYAGSTIMARYAVPRYGSVKVLFWELVGGVLILAILLPLFGRTPHPAHGAASWLYIAALGLGAVFLANMFFFAAVKRIDAAPTAVAASIEPFVGAILALLLFDQQLRWFGWLGLAMVIGGVAGGALEERQEEMTQ